MLLPFLGLPPSTDLVLLLIAGLSIMILAFLSAREFYIKLSDANGESTDNQKEPFSFRSPRTIQPKELGLSQEVEINE